MASPEKYVSRFPSRFLASWESVDNWVMRSYNVTILPREHDNPPAYMSTRKVLSVMQARPKVELPQLSSAGEAKKPRGPRIEPLRTPDK